MLSVVLGGALCFAASVLLGSGLPESSLFPAKDSLDQLAQQLLLVRDGQSPHHNISLRQNGIILASPSTDCDFVALTQGLQAVADAQFDLNVLRAGIDAAEAPAAPPAAEQAPTAESEEAKRLREGGLLPPLQPAAPTEQDAVEGETSASVPEGEQPEGQASEEQAPGIDISAPPPREEPAPDTRESNTAIVSKMQSLENQQEVEAGAVESVQAISGEAPQVQQYSGDPLQQLVNVDFREMELANVVALLAHKAGINIIAGADLTGTVTANLKQIPLIQAMETALRMNGLGIVEEEGIYRIVPYEEAVTSQRTSVLVNLKNARAEDIEKVLKDLLQNSKNQKLFTITANKTTNVIVISGPEGKLDTFLKLAQDLDVEQPMLPTVTEAIKLNYAEPDQLVPMLEKMLTPEVGKLAADIRARHLVITDIPVVVEQIRQLVKSMDIPVKQVILDTMVVDAIMSDEAETGVKWLINAIQEKNTRQTALGDKGRAIGSLQSLAAGAALATGSPATSLTYRLLTSDFDWQGAVEAEIRNRNANLVSNPVLVTVENKEAKITISQEIPYTELTQTSAGGSQTNTRFKDVGTVLSVTPQVTHDDHIICMLDAKESSRAGESTSGVPIEFKRQMSSSVHMKSGQTIFIGGLRKRDSDNTIRKVPVLGDIPLINIAFRNNKGNSQFNELMIFLTCRVFDEEHPELTPYKQKKYDEAVSMPAKVDLQGDYVRDMIQPHKTRDPLWKWRRAE